MSIWDDTRSSPLHSYKWGADSVLSVKFNPAESSLLASTGIVSKASKNNDLFYLSHPQSIYPYFRPCIHPYDDDDDDNNYIHL